MASMVNPYEMERLSPDHLQILFPSNFYGNDEALAQHLTVSCLCETMEWDGDTAIGETAFWLKVLSTPEHEELKEFKRQFKSGIYNQTITPKAPLAGITVSISDDQIIENEAVDEESADWSDMQNLITAANNQMRAKPLKRAPVATFTSGSDVIHARKKNVTVRSATQGVTQGTALVISQKSQLGGAMDEQMVYKCKYCTYGAEERDTLLEHIDQNHAEELPHACPFPGCSYRTKYAWVIKNHHKSQHETTFIKCEKCPYQCKMAYVMKRHEKAVHQTHENYKCPHCDYIGYPKSHVLKHVRVVHQKENRLKCPHCDYLAFAKCHLRNHINMHHTQANKYVCTKCSFTTHGEYSFKVHLRTDCGRNKPKSDPEKEKLRRERYKEKKKADRAAGIPPRTIRRPPRPANDGAPFISVFKCTRCDFSTPAMVALRSHIKAKHERPPVICPKCPMRFPNPRTLKVHLAKRHQIVGNLDGTPLPDDDSEEWLRCDKCDFKSLAVIALRSHMKAKHDRPRFPCPQCSQILISENRLCIHLGKKHRLREEEIENVVETRREEGTLFTFDAEPTEDSLDAPPIGEESLTSPPPSTSQDETTLPPSTVAEVGDD